ncbi:copper resistance CopC family protein [Effusibacillus consociatus]|uniref:Copper resistance protein CopC n=1 Tax=Effusibacillus consociatus TaxID=1117041 RepID=A0ABV9Q5Y3_9BACL
MIKKMFLFFAVIFSLVSSTALAHSALESSTPKNGDVMEKVDEVLLQFNTKIEPSSTLTVRNDKGETVSVHATRLDEKTLKGSFSEALPNGTYTVKWKIVGSDGHPIEGNYSFVVKRSEEKQESGMQSANRQPDTIKQQETTSNDEQKESPQKSSMRVIWLAAVLAIFALTGFWWIMRKKGK